MAATTNLTERMKAPGFMFPCASRVTMPQVGNDERALMLHTPRPPSTESTKIAVQTKPTLAAATVSKDYIKKISADITFSDEVIEDRCRHLMPYSDKYFYDALDISDIVVPPPKAKFTMVRHNKRGEDRRHQPCHIKSRVPYKLKPMKRKILDKAAEMHKEVRVSSFSFHWFLNCRDLTFSRFPGFLGFSWTFLGIFV